MRLNASTKRKKPRAHDRDLHVGVFLSLVSAAGRPDAKKSASIDSVQLRGSANRRPVICAASIMADFRADRSSGGINTAPSQSVAASGRPPTWVTTTGSPPL